MFDKPLSIIAPHYCCGCDEIGCLLCSNCKYNIINEPEMFCIVCGRPTGTMNLCNSCRVPYERVWLVGKREGILQRLVGSYKFERVIEAHEVLGDLLLEVLPELPPDTLIVPVPTTSGRIRERGYDHMLLITRYIAKKRGLVCKQLLLRKNDSKQRQASANIREIQAKQAFYVEAEINADTPILLVDDVVTTGSTIKYASKALKKAGAIHVWVAVIARQ
ncbi:MAG TPA: phosphoribosyltransferase family protein [Candidatus Saccharibacteria bacterium]|nr:phosphoribosyltransferase family protein [Candidatus Saccharibacteria bacterium]